MHKHHYLKTITFFIIAIITSMIILSIQEKTKAANTVTVIDYPTQIVSDNNFLLINNISYELIVMHIKIGHSQKDSGPLKLEASSDILLTISDSEMLLKADDIQNLKNSTDKRQTFQTSLWEINSALDEGNFFIMLLTQNISNLTTQRNECLQEKKISDKNYFDSIQAYDQGSMVKSLQQSSISTQCIAQTSMGINAQNVLLDKLNFYHNLLQKKFDFLSSKENLILNNLDIMDPSLLQELIDIKQTLDTYK